MMMIMFVSIILFGGVMVVMMMQMIKSAEFARSSRRHVY